MLPMRRPAGPQVGGQTTGGRGVEGGPLTLREDTQAAVPIAEGLGLVPEGEGKQLDL